VTKDYGAFSGRHQFNLTQSTIGEPAAGDGIPDNTFLTGIKNIGISEGGAYTSACPAIPAAGATPAITARRALNCTGERSNTGAELGRVFVFDASGNLVPNNVIRDLRTVGSGNAIGGLGSTLLLTGQLDPGLTRYAGNILAHYDFADAFKPFVMAALSASTQSRRGSRRSTAARWRRPTASTTRSSPIRRAAR